MVTVALSWCNRFIFNGYFYRKPKAENRKPLFPLDKSGIFTKINNYVERE